MKEIRSYRHWSGGQEESPERLFIRCTFMAAIMNVAEGCTKGTVLR